MRSIVIVVCVCLLPMIASAQVARKPNVLFIMADDLCADLGCYGVEGMQTPNLDKLAARGVRFERAYCQYPLCGPSRCSLMSGLRPETEGVLGNGLPVRHRIQDLVTLPQLFRQNGYTSFRVGKIYHLNIPDGVGTPGPDDPPSWDHTFNPKGDEYSTDGEVYDPNSKNGQSFRRVIVPGEGEKQADYQSADEAIRILRENKDKPFFLAVGFIRPHVPELAPAKFFDMYPMESIRLAKVVENDRDDIPAMAFGNPIDFGMDEHAQKESLRAYHSTTSFMDAQVGRVVDELDKLGLGDNTIVTFISDHGYSLGQHRAWQKMMLFERVCRVPMIVAPPKATNAGKTARGIVELLDLYPTVAELAGLKGPAALEGKSAAGLVEDPSAPGKQAAFTMLVRPKMGHLGRTVRTDRYRYTEWNDGSAGVELYDYQADPDEFTNLAKDPAHAKDVAELKAILATNPHPPATQP